MKFNIATLPGDGIGPEIIEQAVKVVKAVGKKMDIEFDFKTALVGACAIDATGNPLPEETLELMFDSDAVLFGAIGDPKYDNDPTAKIRPEQGLLKMRKELGLFANLRPVQTFKTLLDKSPIKREIVEGVDFLVFRELTGGIYFGRKGRKDDVKTAYDTMHYSKEEIVRISRLAFKSAMVRRKKLTLVDKANVLESSRLWRETVQEYSKKYPEVQVDYMFVDNAAMQIILNPRQFDVVLTENLFGDIITDEASVLAGSLGLLPSASIGIHTSVFEPIHGSYPQAAGKNIANPIGTILSAAMMFEYALKMEPAGKLIREAVDNSLENEIVTSDITKGKSYSTTEVGQWIADYISQK